MEREMYELVRKLLKYESAKTRRANLKAQEKFVQDLRLKEVGAVDCGCLGNCGNGPNLVILPSEIFVSHVQTVAKMTEILRAQCETEISEDFVSATQLRLAGNAAARIGDLNTAEEYYTKALAIGIKDQRHLLLANRSGVRLSKQNFDGALQDAETCITSAPVTYATGHLRLIDVYYAQKAYQKAWQCLQDLAQRNPEFCRTADYQTIAKQLKRDMESAKA